MIAMAMAGKAAEEIKFGEDNVSSGPVSDIQQVSRVARAMVTQFGMSDAVGNIDYSDERENFLGTFPAGANRISGPTQKLIEDEVRRLIDDGYATAKRILTEHKEEFIRLAEGLLEYETLTGDEITKVIAGEKLDRSDDSDLPPVSGDGSHAAVPKAGKPKRPDLDGEGGMEPQPQ
jgi:cell division protease FtsH